MRKCDPARILDMMPANLSSLCTLSGIQDERVVFLIHGRLNIGKTVFLALLREMMGSYAFLLSPAFLRQEPGPTDLLLLKRTRCAVGVRLSNPQAVIALTQQQGAQIALNPEEQGLVSFQPEWKLWLEARTHAHEEVCPSGIEMELWMRVYPIHFSACSLAKAQRDPRLYTTLRLELPGMLTWAVHGCRMWQEEEPESSSPLAGRITREVKLWYQC